MIKLKDNKDFISVISLINSIIYEVNLDFYEDKISVRAVHPSNSNMLYVDIKKEFFLEYKEVKEAKYKVSLEDLIKVLKLCKGEIEINFSEENIEFKSGKNIFNLNYFIEEETTRNKPNINPKFKFQIDSSKFYNYIEDASSIDEITKIEYKDSLMFLNNNSSKIKSKIEITDFKIMNKEVEEVVVLYDLELLKLSSGFKNLFKDINVLIDNDTPLIIQGESEKINCEFILANRVE